ncbi:MAG: GWxTD domain-containing protein [Bacteroidetes bacterium]|nr:GWxTD domain-containing protein [Bacteroidota bacterium]
MKKIFILLFLSASIGNANAQITAYFSNCTFNTPDNKPFVETYLCVLGNSVLFKKNAKGKYQGQVEVGILFSKNGQIKASKKYNLLSPELSDTLNRPSFIDQQRFPLDTGTYDIELMITDKNSNGKTFSMKGEVEIVFPVDKVTVSSIELLSSFSKAATSSILSKNGYDLIPYTSDFYPENINEFSFYAEVYNLKSVLGENEKFLISYYIETYENKSHLAKYTVSKRETTNVVSIILSKFNIENLASGNYNFVIDIRNKSNELIAQRKTFFQRKNANVKFDVSDLSAITIENTFAARISGKDTISDFIRSLRPIASEAEKGFLDNQLKLADTKLMQQFFYNFWLSRSPLAPEEAWNKYYQNVQAVNAKFGSFNYKGYATDRGRVYLQYGPPDKREEAPSEPTAYPYEIWVYYKLTDNSKLNPNQTNKQFIFYNQDLVTNKFQLLHSDALSEIHDSQWQMKLHKRTVQSNDFEHLNAPEHYGGNSNDEFKNPK